jgi:DNA processing protein
MDRDTLLLAACMACAGNSLELARWLAEPFHSASDLVSPARARRARVRSETVAAFTAHLAQPSLPRQRHQLHQDGWHMLAKGDAQWPTLLDTLHDAPVMLFVRGNPGLLDTAQLAMVGARHASTEGLDNARRFARLLAQAGFTITSGLALGIDAAAHRGATESGRTLAVLGNGPGPCYPARNRELAERIVAGGGALMTEFPPGLGPHKAFFPQRNRLISGLSLATIVIEAAEHSGSLITARTAIRQGREVFAIPGSIHNPLSKGCHRLLRDGANWLETVQDILDAFPGLHAIAQSTPDPTAAPHPLLHHFISGPNSIDQLQQRSGIPITELARTLAELELSGQIQRTPGGYARRHGQAAELS